MSRQRRLGKLLGNHETRDGQSLSLRDTRASTTGDYCVDQPLQRTAPAQFHQQHVADRMRTTIRSASTSSRINNVSGSKGKGHHQPDLVSTVQTFVHLIPYAVLVPFESRATLNPTPQYCWITALSQHRPEWTLPFDETDGFAWRTNHEVCSVDRHWKLSTWSLPARGRGAK